MSNNLSKSNSPYLLQHAENPVEWFPWDDEAINKAKTEDKPIFLSIGYAACHWCHVMAHESFEDPETAAIMNQHFVNVKVDREERPDLDNIYMNAVVSLTGSGGWPLSVFMTPDGKPFFGGTYFPPTPRFNLPSFREVLLSIARLWQEDRERLNKSGEDITNHIRKIQSVSTIETPISKELLEQASLRLAQSYDWKNGGWGQAPKFPQPMAILFLLNRAVQGDQLALDMATHALDSMSTGGMYDIVGGGFARYSTDDLWLMPHFEKMLYDNALLALTYLRAYLVTKRPQYRKVCESTLDFLIREMAGEIHSGSISQVGFYSSLDADSEGEEGKFYIWSYQELMEILNQAQIETADSNFDDWFGFFVAAYGLSEGGNFEGRNVLQRVKNDFELSEEFDIGLESVTELLDQMHFHILQARDKRVKPGLDDKVLVSWNSLALIAFAEAARYLQRADYLRIAQQNARFLITNLKNGNHLFRSWRKGKSQYNGYLEDYAALILGLLSIYQSDPDIKWYKEAYQIAQEMNVQFRDPQGGFFDTRQDQDSLIIRPKDLQDNAIPSGNSLASLALFQLYAFTGENKWREEGENTLQQILKVVVEHPLAFSFWLLSIDLALASISEVAIIGDPSHPVTESMVRVMWSSFRPHSVFAMSNNPPPENSPPLLLGKEPIDGLPTAFVCRSFVCKQPVNQVEDFKVQLVLKQ